MNLTEMILKLESIGYHPDDLKGYSEDEILESYEKEFSN